MRLGKEPSTKAMTSLLFEYSTKAYFFVRKCGERDVIATRLQIAVGEQGSAQNNVTSSRFNTTFGRSSIKISPFQG